MFIYIGNFRSNQAKRRVKALSQRHKNRMRKNRIFRVAPAKYATFIFNAPRHDEKKNKKMRNSITATRTYSSFYAYSAHINFYAFRISIWQMRFGHKCRRKQLINSWHIFFCFLFCFFNGCVYECVCVRGGSKMFAVAFKISFRCLFIVLLVLSLLRL